MAGVGSVEDEVGGGGAGEGEGEGITGGGGGRKCFSDEHVAEPDIDPAGDGGVIIAGDRADADGLLVS